MKSLTLKFAALMLTAGSVFPGAQALAQQDDDRHSQYVGIVAALDKSRAARDRVGGAAALKALGTLNPAFDEAANAVIVEATTAQMSRLGLSNPAGTAVPQAPEVQAHKEALVLFLESFSSGDSDTFAQGLAAAARLDDDFDAGSRSYVSNLFIAP